MTEVDLLALLLPIFVPVLLGWVVVRVGAMADSDAKALMAAFQCVFLPALLISCLAKESLADLEHLRYSLATLVLLAGLYGGLLAIHRKALGRTIAESATAAFVGVRFNTVALGLPLLTVVLGSRAAVPVVINLVLGYFTLLPLTLALVNVGRRDASAPGGIAAVAWAALRDTLGNPMVWSALIGLALAVTETPLPGWVDRSLSLLGGAAIAVPLVAVGMTMGRLSLAGHAIEVLWMSAARVVVAPALAMALALAFDLPAFDSVALVVSFSLPTAKLAYAVAEKQQVYERQAAAILALTTSSLPIVFPLWILACERLWPGTVAMQKAWGG